MYRADFIAEVVPGLVLVAATYIAAVPAFRTVRRSSRGRARVAMAWLFGFLAGVVATTLLSLTIGQAADPDAPVNRKRIARCVSRTIHWGTSRKMARTTQEKTTAPGTWGRSAAVKEAADDVDKIKRLAEVDQLLDLIAGLPLGHPDRLRLLTDAEQILAS